MMVFTANHPILKGDQIQLYYGGGNEDHGRIGSDGSMSVGLAFLRKDGFVSLDAQDKIGTITTKKLAGFQGELGLNYKTAANGWVKVEVLDQANQVVEGFSEADCNPLSGDSIDQIVTWGSKTELPQKVSALRFRFTLQNASIFSFRAGESIRVVE